MGDLVAFVECCLDVIEDAETELDEMAAAYFAWCLEQNLKPLSPEGVDEGLEEFCRVGGLSKRVQNGKIIVHGVGLTEVARA